MTTTSKTQTLREAVEDLGFDFDRVAPGFERDADTEVVRRAATDEDGRVFVHCSGEALFAFQPVNRLRRALYLVRDSQEYDTWGVRRTADFNGESIATVVALGPCPRPRLRLVQSA